MSEGEETPQLALQTIFDSLEAHGYTFVSRLGSGSFGQVFTVRHSRYEEIFCAKVIDMSAHKGPKCKWNTFTLELKSLVDLSHINIINVFDQWELDDFCCLILEYVEGGTLTEYIRVHQKLTGSHLLSFCQQLVSALAYCHSVDICHRDIKPDNILIDRHGRPKMCDFGFACKKTDREAAFVCGSLPYMSPELVAGTNLDPFASDVWALGITFYFMAVGHLPWSYREPESLVPEIVTKDIEIPADLPEKFIYILSRMLQRNPMTRPTMAQVEKFGFFNDGARISSDSSAGGLPPMIPRSHTLRSRKQGMASIVSMRSLGSAGIVLPSGTRFRITGQRTSPIPQRLLHVGLTLTSADVTGPTGSLPVG